MTTLNLTHKKGDTFQEMLFEIIYNGMPLDLNGAAIKMQLRKTAGGLVALDLSIGNGITMVDADFALFKIDTQIINIEAYDYLYDIQIVAGSLANAVNTWISGFFKITNDITR